MKLYSMIGHEEDPFTAKRLVKAINNAGLGSIGQKLLFNSPQEAREYYKSRGMPIEKGRTIEFEITSFEDE